MNPTRRLGRLRECTLSVCMGGVGVLILLSAFSLPNAQNPTPPNKGEVAPSAPAVNNPSGLTTPPPQAEPEKSKHEKIKGDAAELSALADQLRDQIDKMNIHIFSLEVVQRTEAIEKLAKKIRVEADAH